MENDTKICNGVLCNGKVLPIDKFPVVKGKIRYVCRSCKNESSRLSKLRNKDKIKEKEKIYRQDNKDKINQRNKIYSQNNKAKIQERRKKNQHIKNVKEIARLQIEDLYIQNLINNLKSKDLKKKREFNIDIEYIKELQKEENRFNDTLEQGIKVFEKTIKGKEQISGKDAFLLYQSYGFPIEMTKELASEKNISIDEKGFGEEEQKHQELSRTATEGKFKSGLADSSEQTTKLHTATHLLNQAQAAAVVLSQAQVLPPLRPAVRVRVP